MCGVCVYFSLWDFFIYCTVDVFRPARRLVSTRSGDDRESWILLVEALEKERKKRYLIQKKKLLTVVIFLGRKRTRLHRGSLFGTESDEDLLTGGEKRTVVLSQQHGTRNRHFIRRNTYFFFSLSLLTIIFGFSWNGYISEALPN